MYNEPYLSHFGVKGMKWGIRKEQEPRSFDSPEGLQAWLKQNVKYSEFTRLKSPSEVLDSKSGSCHDQVMLELDVLSRMGVNPHALFLMEYMPGKNVGGQTHSFVHYQKGNKTYWLENAWGDQAGLHEFDSLKDIKREISKLHKTGQTGNSKEFPNLAWGVFDRTAHSPGETLEELVDICMNTKPKTGGGLVHNDPYLAHFGVKGMRWGIRRTLAQLGRGRSGGTKPGSPPVKLKPPAPKRASEMTDTELKERLNRLDMERRYNQYMAEMNPKKESRFKKFALAALERGASTMVDAAFRQMATNLTAKATPEQVSITDLIKKGRKDLGSLSTDEMGRLNKHYSAEKLLKKTFDDEDVLKKIEEGKKIAESLRFMDGGGI